MVPAEDALEGLDGRKVLDGGLGEVDQDEGRVGGDGEHVDEGPLAPEVQVTYALVVFQLLALRIAHHVHLHAEDLGGLVGEGQGVDNHPHDHPYGQVSHDR